jgi:hypothetical protein
MTMNAKKCKQIRQSMKRGGQDWREAEFKQVTLHNRLLPVPHQVVNPIHLEAGCGRKLYKEFKALMA